VVHHYGKLIKERETEKAEHYYELGKQKLEKDPNNLKALQELATQAQQLERYGEAIELWQRAIALTREHPVGLFYFNLGYCYMMLEQYEEAIDASNKAIGLDPSLKEAALNLATCEIIAGSLDQALALLNGVLEEEPDYPPAVLLAAMIFCIQSEAQKVKELFHRLLQKKFSITDALNRMAKQLFSQGKAVEALAILNAAIQNGVSDQETLKLMENVNS
jgi:tetratricopeptide (TPR) repeat protein